MKKTVIFFIVSIFIIFKSGWDYSECNIRTANQVLTPELWYEQRIDGTAQNTLITRFYHNKVGVLGSELAKCYFDRLNPNFFFETGGIFSVILLVYLFFILANRRKWLYLTILFLLPTIPVFSVNLPTSIRTISLLAYLYKGLAIISLGVFLFKKQ